MRIWIQLISVAILLAWTGVAGAQVFHSQADDGVPTQTTSNVGPGQSVTLYLYYSTGTLPTTNGEICHTGDGDEICAIDIGLTSTGGLSFVSFVPDAGQDIDSAMSPNAFDINLLDTGVPTLGVHRIGALTLQAAPVVCTASCRASWERTKKVTASLKLEELGFTPAADDVVVEVPEPRMAWLLSFGSLMLAKLTILKRRQSARLRA